MRRTLVAGWLILAVAAGGCGGHGSGGGGGGTTPEETFNTMKEAAVKKDWNGMVSCMTPQTQEMMLGGMTMMVQFMGVMPGGGDKMKGASEILSRHGAKVDASAMTGLGADPTKSNPQEAMKKLTADVKDKPACLAELMAWFEKNGDANTKNSMGSEQISNSTLSDVKIEGDRATGKVTMKKDGKDQTQDVQFQKIDGKWYADMSAELNK